MIAEFINELDANFVLAVILFLVFFCFGMAAAISDAILKWKDERANKRYLEQYHAPIGRVTDYRVISSGYKAAHSSKLKAERLRDKGKR